MVRHVLRNNRGMTLVEMLISIFIIAIVGMALLQMSLVSMSTNLQNAIRDEAVTVVNERMSQLRTLRFNDRIIDAGLSATGGPIPDGAIQRNIRNTTVTYNMSRDISDIGGGVGVGAKQVTIGTSWTYKGITYNHGITTIVKRAN